MSVCLYVTHLAHISNTCIRFSDFFRNSGCLRECEVFYLVVHLFVLTLVDWCTPRWWCQWEYLYLIRFLPWLIKNNLRMCADGNFCTRSSRNENSSHNDEPASVSNNVQFFCYFFSHPTSPYPKLIPTVTFSLCASHAKKGKKRLESKRLVLGLIKFLHIITLTDIHNKGFVPLTTNSTHYACSFSITLFVTFQVCNKTFCSLFLWFRFSFQ